MSDDITSEILETEEAQLAADEAKLLEVKKVEEAKELVIVPSFQMYCHVCGWAKTNIPLYNWTTQQSLNGLSPGRLAKALKSYMQEHYPNIKCPTRQSIWNHFEKHIEIRDVATIHIARQGNYERKSGVKLLSESALKELEEVRKGNFDEYKELCDLYIRFRDVRNNIYEFTKALQIDQENGGDVWSQTKITTFVSMVNTQKSVLAEISKMRQGEKLIKIAAEYSLQSFAKALVGRLTEEFATLATIMRKHGVPADMLDAYDQITHERLADVVLAEAQKAMDETRKEFKLPN